MIHKQHFELNFDSAEAHKNILLQLMILSNYIIGDTQTNHIVVENAEFKFILLLLQTTVTNYTSKCNTRQQDIRDNR